MNQRLMILVSLAGVLVLLASHAFAQEKIKLASGIKLSPVYYLPTSAGQEQGIFKQNGLEVEWVPFRSGALEAHAMVAGQIDMSMGVALSSWLEASRGVPVMIVAKLLERDTFSIWVSAATRFFKPEDIKGIRLGVSSLSGTERAYGRLVANALGLEKEVKFIATGGIPQSMAALKAGIVDGAVLPITQMAELKIKGQVREYLSVENYRPQPWAAYIIRAHKKMIGQRPEAIRRLVKAFAQVATFIKNNPAWSLSKMKEMQGYSPAGAEMVFRSLAFATDPGIEAKALENVRQFIIEYGLLTAGETLPLEKVYTPQFIQ